MRPPPFQRLHRRHRLPRQRRRKTKDIFAVIAFGIVAGFAFVNVSSPVLESSSSVMTKAGTVIVGAKQGNASAVISNDSEKFVGAEQGNASAVISNDSEKFVGETATTLGQEATLPVTLSGTAAEAVQQQQQQPNEDPQQKPLQKFYAVHIGPSKTGTSAIQKYMRDNPFTANTLSKDNVIYVGKVNGEEWPDTNRYNQKTIRTINGTSFTPMNERLQHMRVVPCMVQKLEDYYDSHSTEDRDSIDLRLENDEDTRTFLREIFTNECWAAYNARYMLDYSIFDSDEAYSYTRSSLYSYVGKDYGKLGRRFRCFDILGYEKLVVVGAYRRYAEWTISAYTESIKVACTRPNLEGDKLAHTCPSLRLYLHDLLQRTSENRRTKRRRNPDDSKFGCRFYENLHITLPEIAEEGPSKLETKVLNFFQLPEPTFNNSDSNNTKGYDSITTELYCDALGEELTPHTCRHAQTIAKERAIAKASSSSTSSLSLVANKGTTSNSVYQSIVSTAHLLGFIVPTKKQIERQKQKCLGSFCDAEASCVDKKKPNSCIALINTRNEKYEDFLEEHDGTPPVVVGSTASNITNWKDLSDYHSKVHGLAWTSTLPIVCPNPEELNVLLERSLELEERVVPKFYATALGKEELKRIFYDVWLQEKKLFCWVDLHRLFRNAASWDEIINERMVNYNWTVTY